MPDVPPLMTPFFFSIPYPIISTTPFLQFVPQTEKKEIPFPRYPLFVALVVLADIYILQFHNVGSLFTTVAFDNVEFYSLAFFQSFEAFTLDCGEMNEYIAAIFPFNETITLFSIKPFNFASHLYLAS